VECLGPETLSNPRYSDSDDTLKVTRDQIRKTLNEVDPSICRVWDELGGFIDTNQLILFNLQQVQVHVQKAQQELYERQRYMDAVLAKIIDKGEEYFHEYLREKERLEGELREHRKHIQALMRDVTSMAKEYRQCAMQKKFNIHISQVLQFQMAVKASIHRHIHDKVLLESIARELTQAGLALFPTGQGEDI